MAAQRHDKEMKGPRFDQDKRDRELDAWMDKAIGARKPDPDPKLRDL